MPILAYPKEEILQRMRFENPWWVSRRIDVHYARMKPRPYLGLFWKLVLMKVNRAVVLMGPRRVGKTVMMFHTTAKLLEQGVDPLRIVFISVETPIYLGLSLDQLFYAGSESDGPDHDRWLVRAFR
jgi:predicted AAA+ superfamily ATPase